MTQTTLSPDLAQQLDDLRAKGHRVFGPGPMTPGQTTPTADAQVTTPGMHVQIGAASGQLIEGVGATADDAARDALSKLGGVSPSGKAA